jgi:kumamolisin
MLQRVRRSTNGQPVGYLNPSLYPNQSAFNDITQGNNGDFASAPGWDACTGMGSPIGAKIAAVFAGKAAAKHK